MSSNPTTNGPQILTTLSTSVSDLPKVGEITAAPVAPPKGPTGQPSEVPVIVVGKAFWQNETIKALRNMVVGAFGAVAVFLAAQIIANGGVFGIDWTKTGHAAVNAGFVALAMAYAAWWKSRDNNPISGAPKPDPTSLKLK